MNLLFLNSTVAKHSAASFSKWIANFFMLLLLLTFSCQSEKAAPQKAVPEKQAPEEVVKPNQLSAVEKAAGWQLLFDGQSTGQWRSYNGQNFPEIGWGVDADGNLTVSSSGSEEATGGDIITKNKHENFELLVDFMVSDTGNSGIFYRVLEMENTPIWHNAPEFQILDNATYMTMGDMTKHLTGENYDLHASTADYSKPVGEWNTARIVVNGQQIEHWLNGQKTVAYEIGSADWQARLKASKFAGYPNYGQTLKGHIGLQDHGHLIKFRNIKIRML